MISSGGLGIPRGMSALGSQNGRTGRRLTTSESSHYRKFAKLMAVAIRARSENDS